MVEDGRVQEYLNKFDSVVIADRQAQIDCNKIRLQLLRYGSLNNVYSSAKLVQIIIRPFAALVKTEWIA